MTPPAPERGNPPPRRKYVRSVGPRLRILLLVILGLVAVLSANSIYLAAVTFLEWLHRAERVSYQNYFYQLMFLAHLVLGLALIVPFVAFGSIHLARAWNRPNRRAVMAGYSLFGLSLAVLATGVLLMRADVFGFKNLGIKNPELRSLAYWAHVITPLLAVWLYLLHRLAGPRIKWRVGVRWAVVAGGAVIAMVFLHSQHPRRSQIGSVEGKQYFEPSQARTASGNFIPPRTLMMDDYCQKCHQDGYQGWFHSAHHFSSFNNQPYMFAVKETRAVALQIDGNVKASRW